ncbi:MAG TPA: APC family permease [Isosphaeraceae bacterium]|nr:APC family permease [Isosphaeraceae bacterium]
MTVSGSIAAAEIAAMMPRAGGQYVFLREAYSPLFGFLFGWAMFLVVQTGTIAAVAVAFAKFLGVFFPQVAANVYVVEPIHLGAYALSLSRQQLVAIALIAVLTAVNTRGLKLGKWIQNTFTITKTGALLGLVVVGLWLGTNRQSAAWTSSWWDSAVNGWDSKTAFPGLPVEGQSALWLLLGLAMIGPLFSQSAWNNVTFTGSETRDPGRTLPRAMILGVVTVILLYFLANVAYVVTLPLSAIQNARYDRVGTAALEAILGPRGEAIMAGAILISTFGCVNGLVLAGARVYYAMAGDGLFFRGVATTNRCHVPAVALIAQGVWAALLALPVTVSSQPSPGMVAYGDYHYGNLYGELLEYVIPVDVTFYALMVGGVVALRRKAPALERPYRAIGYPLPVLVYIGLAVLLVLDFIYLKPWTSGKGYLIVLAGIPVYLVWSRLATARARVA